MRFSLEDNLARYSREPAGWYEGFLSEGVLYQGSEAAEVDAVDGFDDVLAELDGEDVMLRGRLHRRNRGGSTPEYRLEQVDARAELLGEKPSGTAVGIREDRNQLVFTGNYEYDVRPVNRNWLRTEELSPLDWDRPVEGTGPTIYSLPVVRSLVGLLDI